MLRPDLLFLHAGVVAAQEGAVLLVGDSGAGKSTLTWGLVCQGFPYLSDELAPIALEGVRVHPHPRAIALKVRTAAPFEVPPGTLETSQGFRVAIDAVGSGAAPEPRRVRGIFLVEPEPVPAGTPALRPVGAAEAAARLLTNTLNPASHPADGLDAVLEIARAAPAFELRRTDLRTSCDLVRATVVGGLDPGSAASTRSDE